MPVTLDTKNAGNFAVFFGLCLFPDACLRYARGVRQFCPG